MLLRNRYRGPPELRSKPEQFVSWKARRLPIDIGYKLHGLLPGNKILIRPPNEVSSRSSSALGGWQLEAGGLLYSLYLAVVVSVSNTVTSLTRTRPLVTRSSREFDS
jgi:hypothetical protein